MHRSLLPPLLIATGLSLARAAPPGQGTTAPRPAVDLYAEPWQGDWRGLRPLALLELLKAHPDKPVSLASAPRDWLQPGDVGPLMALLDSTEPVSATAPMESQHLVPRGFHSTVGWEAARMLDDARHGWPYPSACSDLDAVDVRELRHWWHDHRGR